MEYSPGLRGVIAGETSISTVGKEGTSLRYRGYDATNLTSKNTYEDVAALIIQDSFDSDNFKEAFTKFYNAAPVSITVEGSNTLTRSLIIFGQGLNKSHPHIYDIFRTLEDDNLKQFEKDLNEIKQDYLYTIEPKIYFNKIWDDYFLI